MEDLAVGQYIKVNGKWDIVTSIGTDGKVETYNWRDIGKDEIEEVSSEIKDNVWENIELSADIDTQHIILNFTEKEKKFSVWLQLPNHSPSVHSLYVDNEFVGDCSDFEDDSWESNMIKKAIEITESYLLKDYLNMAFYSQTGEKYDFYAEDDNYYLVANGEDYIFLKYDRGTSEYYHVGLYSTDVFEMPKKVKTKLIEKFENR